MKWLPVSAIPHIACEMEGLLAADEENYQALLEAKLRPGILGRETLERLIQAFTAQRRDLAPCDQQLVRWKRALKSDAYLEELNRISERLEKIRQVIACTLALASEVKASTPAKGAQAKASSPPVHLPPFGMSK